MSGYENIQCSPEQLGLSIKSQRKKNLFLTGATKAVINSCIDNHTEDVKDFFFRRGYNEFIKVLLHM